MTTLVRALAFAALVAMACALDGSCAAGAKCLAEVSSNVAAQVGKNEETGASVDASSMLQVRAKVARLEDDTPPRLRELTEFLEQRKRLTLHDLAAIGHSGRVQDAVDTDLSGLTSSREEEAFLTEQLCHDPNGRACAPALAKARIYTELLTNILRFKVKYVDQVGVNLDGMVGDAANDTVVVKIDRLAEEGLADFELSRTVLKSNFCQKWSGFCAPLIRHWRASFMTHDGEEATEVPSDIGIKQGTRPGDTSTMAGTLLLLPAVMHRAQCWLEDQVDTEILKSDVVTFFAEQEEATVGVLETLHHFMHPEAPLEDSLSLCGTEPEGAGLLAMDRDQVTDRWAARDEPRFTEWELQRTTLAKHDKHSVPVALVAKAAALHRALGRWTLALEEPYARASDSSPANLIQRHGIIFHEACVTLRCASPFYTGHVEPAAFSLVHKMQQARVGAGVLRITIRHLRRATRRAAESLTQSDAVLLKYPATLLAQVSNKQAPNIAALDSRLDDSAYYGGMQSAAFLLNRHHHHGSIPDRLLPEEEHELNRREAMLEKAAEAEYKELFPPGDVAPEEQQHEEATALASMLAKSQEAAPPQELLEKFDEARGAEGRDDWWFVEDIADAITSTPRRRRCERRRSSSWVSQSGVCKEHYNCQPKCSPGFKDEGAKKKPPCFGTVSTGVSVGFCAPGPPHCVMGAGIKSGLSVNFVDILRSGRYSWSDVMGKIKGGSLCVGAGITCGITVPGVGGAGIQTSINGCYNVFSGDAKISIGVGLGGGFGGPAPSPPACWRFTGSLSLVCCSLEWKNKKGKIVVNC